MNNNIDEILRKTKEYMKKTSFDRFNSPGLLQPKFGYVFSPSAGHHVIDEIVVSKKEPAKLQKFSVTPDRSMRMYDVEKIGFSNRHLSFFETLVFGYSGAHEILPKEQATKEIFNLFLQLGLNPNKLLVTTLKDVTAEGTILNSSEDEPFRKSWSKLIGNDSVKTTNGRRNLFYSRISGNPGGSGCELYYNIKGNYIEIGSQVNYKFLFSGGLQRTRNAAILQGFGIERLLMALENKDHISDVSLLQPLKETVKQYLPDDDKQTIQMYNESLVKIVDSARSILFILYDTEGKLDTLSKSQRKILNSFRKGIISEVDYLGIYNPQIIRDLFQTGTTLFENRYSDIHKVTEKAIDYVAGND